MAGTLVRTRAAAMEIGLVSPGESPSATEAIEGVLNEALVFCAQKMGMENHEAVVGLLRQRDRAACGYWLYRAAVQVASALGSMDRNVKAVYILDYDATPEDLCFGVSSQGSLVIHLIVWSEPRTAALCSLIAALDRALAQACTDLLVRPAVKSLLDAHVVDDADVEGCIGHGALLHSIHHRPMQVWERGDSTRRSL
ncbi:MAG: hypothetical protein H8D77_00650 [Chloroflexi bacterium]|nr:hypothetical protein [Chloroflexota bacterium]